jgi:superfamily II DNA or RNA helicase
MGSVGRLLSTLNADPGVRGRQFERVCRWYLINDPLYRRELKRVWLWKDWPGRWGADAGIDLVAEARDGGLWAIQAKAYDPRYAIKKSDVDTFLSESARPQFSFRLLVATTNEIGATAKRTLEAQEKSGHVLFLADLEKATIDWPRSPDDLVASPPRPKKPRPHQRRAIRDVRRGFETTHRGQLLMACGTGKTLTSLWIAEALGSERTLVLVPSLSLLAQTLREWVANTTREFSFLPVCSDETVNERDSAVSKTADLAFPVTTDPSEIASFLRKRGPRVVFSTYQSSPQVAAAMTGREPGFDLAVADEAHRCTGRVSGEFSTILDDKAIRARRRLFMTATPRYFTGRVVKEAAELDLEVASMDDEARFGPVLHRLTFGEAIEKDLLSDYQVAVVVVDDDTCRDYAKRGTFVTTGGANVTDARTLAAQIGLAKAMRRYDLRRVVSFHSRVAWARNFSRSLPSVIGWMPSRQRPPGALWSSYVSGGMPSGHRDSLLGRLRDLDDAERGLLSNARCLAEGVDVPTLDAVAFIDPRRSEVDVVQAVGRAIRKSPEKKMGTIVLPAFIGRGDNPEADLKSSAFEPVWEVLKALRAHDEQLAEELDELRREMGYRHTSARRPGKIKLLLPVSVGIDFAQAFDTSLVERTTSSWEFMFGRLLGFVQREGHASPIKEYMEDGYKLGAWVGTQRWRKERLPEQKRNRLERLPGWTWNRHADSWEKGFAALRRFAHQYGHVRVPASFVDGEGLQLGQWVRTQRAKIDGLNPTRIGRLESVPGWVWDPRVASWEDGFDRLKGYAAKLGDANPPAAFIDADGFRLGSWVVEQRVKHGNGTLGGDRDARLEALPGWTWNARDMAWDRSLSSLSAFVAERGSARVPRGFVDSLGFDLGNWVIFQRALYRRGAMPEDRAKRLAALSGWSWQPFNAAWETGLARFEVFVAEHGHGQVQQSFVDESGYRLGAWVTKQRSAMRDGRLDTGRRAVLEATPGWGWTATRPRWEEGYERLCSFIERKSSARVPVDHRDPDGFALGGWVHNQRALHAGGKLDPERATLLEELPGWEWDVQTAAWEVGFAHLTSFVGRERHASVPTAHREGDGFRLGMWVSNQRAKHTSGRLPKGRAARLEGLPGWTWDASGDRVSRSKERA